MKPIPLLAPLLLIAGLPARGRAAEAPGDAVQGLMKLERAWGDAIVRRDATAIGRILAEDYLLTTPWGHLVTREQVLRNFKAPRDASFEITAVDLADMAVRVYGETAVVTSRFTLKVRVAGRDAETPYRHLDVFVRQEGRWRCVATQATVIAEAPAPVVAPGRDAPTTRGATGRPRSVPSARRDAGQDLYGFSSS